MTFYNKLREFLTNPFGGEQKVRALLCAIENRPVSDAEFARGLFCFQVASYFLAQLAITAHIEDPLLREISAQQLHDQMRAVYCGTDLHTNCFDLIVAPGERDQFIADFVRQPADVGESRNDSRLGITKLAAFDLVSMRRLCEYRDAMDQPNNFHELYLVAEQVLFHYAAKKFDPIAVVVIAELLSENLKIVSKIVASEFSLLNAEDEEAFLAMPLSPSMPDVASKPPRKIYPTCGHVVLLFEDMGKIGGGGTIKFRYVLAVSHKRSKRPTCFVTLENSLSVSNVLGVFEQDGSHSNYGSLRGPNVLYEFISRGMDLIRERFDLGEIEELKDRGHQPSWWQSLSMQGTRRVFPGIGQRAHQLCVPKT